MKTSHSHLTRTAVILLLPVVFLVSCREIEEPAPAAIQAAKGGNLSVSSVVPNSSARGVTLNVTVNGSGFDQGSAAKFERQGVPATGITTNTTTFVTSRKLIANVTIAADADTGKYDVAVTASDGRKGVGIEAFTVVYVMDELGIIGGTWSRAHAINDVGQVVGTSCTQSCLATAFYWSDADGQVDLGGLTGYTRSGAYAINNRGQVFGAAECGMNDPGCGGVYKQQLVRWDRVGGSWSIAPVNGCSVALPVAEGSQKFLINNNDQCVARTAAGKLLLQTLAGSTIVNQEQLPSVAPAASDRAYGISDAAMIAGSTRASSGAHDEPVVWYRNSSGSWAILRLGFPGVDNRGQAIDISEPDAAGSIIVAGFTMNTNGRTLLEQAALWTLRPDGNGGLMVTSIQVLPDDTGGRTNAFSVARAVNRAGQVVGQVGQTFESGLPVTWLAGALDVLPSLGNRSYGRAVDINSQGWIVGAVFDQVNKCDRATIWRQR